MAKSRPGTTRLKNIYIKRKSTAGVGGGAHTINRLQKKISTLCFGRHPERQVPILHPTCWLNYSYMPNVKLSMQKYSKFINKFMWHARSYEEFLWFFQRIAGANARRQIITTNMSLCHHSVLKDGHLHPPWSGTPALGLQSNAGRPKASSQPLSLQRHLTDNAFIPG